MLRLVVTRTAFALVSLVIVSALIFWCVEWLPGDAASRILGRDATPEVLALLRHKLHLDLPGPVRYLQWLGGAVRGDFGTSLAANQPVLDYVWSRAANTTELAGFVLLLYTPLSIGLGIWTAVSRGRAVDHVASILVILGMCVPEFVVGIVLIVIFAMTLHWFPPLALIDRAHSIGSVLSMLFLPAMTLTIAMTAYAVRMMRENLIEVLDSGYVQMARLKGLPRWRVLVRHALPSALGPALNVTALNIAWLMGGIIVVETVFSFPGLGRLLIDAIDLKDVPVVLAVSLLLTVVYIFCNLLADIAVLMLNPKLRHAG
ncbi:MAG: ABC transporter permease [Methylobacteriaceae bacterium]|nr:ABC transporter permease [Methylobacteriaceae bacterium]